MPRFTPTVLQHPHLLSGFLLLSEGANLCWKLSCTASRGETARDFTNLNHQVRPALRACNLVFLQINGLRAHVLVDTGATVPLMLERFRRRVKAVMTPPDSAVLHGANDAIINVLGLRGATVTVGDIDSPFLGPFLSS